MPPFLLRRADRRRAANAPTGRGSAAASFPERSTKRPTATNPSRTTPLAATNLSRASRSPAGIPSRAGAATAAALALTALVAGSPAAQAAARPDLQVAKVSAAASATPGGLLPVRAVVQATGPKAPRSSVAVYLSTDARRSKQDTRVKLADRLPRLTPGRTLTVPLAAQVPAAQAASTFRVIVCVDDPGKIKERSEANNCRAAKSPITIAPAANAAEGAPAAPADRIAADVSAGKLTTAKAIEYRVLARFGDPKLPTQYAGDPGSAEDDGIMREAASAWPTLPKATRKAIGKYFLPPPVRQALEQDPSALVRAKKKTKRSASTKPAGRKALRLEDDPVTDENDETAAPEVCATEYTRVKTWDSVTAAGGKVRLHWERSKPEDGKTAKSLVGDVTRAYARYKQMLGTEPLSDANVGCYHGPDGALDIYVTAVWYKAGVTVPSAQSDQQQADCEGYPGFIAADGNHPTFKTGYTVAHELFHAFQMAYRYKAGCEDATWLDEGSATWAANLIYPADNTEHLFDFVLEAPHSSIQRDYHAWVFFLWMEHRFGDPAIRSAYRALRTKDSTGAVDQAIGTFRKEFLDFAKAGWNQDPEASFAQWDQLPNVPHVTSGFPSGPVIPVNFHLAGQKERTAYAEFALRALSRDYKRYPITDDKLRQITFKNPLAKNPNVKVGAYLTLASGQVRWEDWSGKEKVKLCRDQPDQDVRDIILVYANATPAKWFSAEDQVIQATPEFGLKDSCEDDLPWHYEVLWGQLTYDLDGMRPGDAKDGLCVLDGFKTRDQVHFSAAADGTGFHPDDNVVRKDEFGDAIGGDFQIIAETPTRTHVLDGCQGWDDFGPKTQCHATHTDHMGPFTVGFSLEAESKSAQEATLNWWIPPAIAGFFDADDSVCNVGNLSSPVYEDDDLRESGVLLSQLRSGEPFTASVSGIKEWDGPAQLGDQGHLTLRFEAKMRLQRVNPDGSPLT